MVIKAIVHKNISRDDVYSGVMSRTLALLKNLDEYSLFHIKRGLNLEVDQKAKEGTSLGKGELKVNGSVRLLPIP